MQNKVRSWRVRSNYELNNVTQDADYSKIHKNLMINMAQIYGEKE